MLEPLQNCYGIRTLGRHNPSQCFGRAESNAWIVVLEKVLQKWHGFAGIGSNSAEGFAEPGVVAGILLQPSNKTRNGSTSFGPDFCQGFCSFSLRVHFPN